MQALAPQPRAGLPPAATATTPRAVPRSPAASTPVRSPALAAGRMAPVSRQRAPLSSMQNRSPRPVSQRRTCTWVEQLIVSPGGHPADQENEPRQPLPSTKAAAPKAGRKNKAPATASQKTRRAGHGPAWCVDFVGDVPEQPIDDSARVSPQPPSEQCSAGAEPATQPCDKVATAHMRPAARNPGRPTSDHPLATPQPGGITRMLASRAEALAAAAAPSVSHDPEMQRALATHAATAAVNVPPGARLYNTVQALPAPAPKASPAAVRKLAAARRTAALARLPRADIIAPSMADLWRPEEHVIEVRHLFFVYVSQLRLVGV